MIRNSFDWWVPTSKSTMINTYVPTKDLMMPYGFPSEGTMTEPRSPAVPCFPLVYWTPYSFFSKLALLIQSKHVNNRLSCFPFLGQEFLTNVPRCNSHCVLFQELLPFSPPFQGDQKWYSQSVPSSHLNAPWTQTCQPCSWYSPHHRCRYKRQLVHKASWANFGGPLIACIETNKTDKQYNSSEEGKAPAEGVHYFHKWSEPKFFFWFGFFSEWPCTLHTIKRFHFTCRAIGGYV